MKRSPRLKTYISISFAASVIFFLVSYFFLFPKTVTSGRAQRQPITLPDLSTVLLNAESEIEYRPWNWKTIDLKGEAYFDVQPGGKFIVETREGTVEVTGTQFNVCQRGEDFVVSCFSGSVHVRSGNSSLDLHEGETTRLVESKLTRGPANEKTASWRNGEFYFENAPFASVVEELERQLDLDIELPASTLPAFSGYFSIRNPEEALQSVLSPMNLTYTRTGNKIIVR